MAFTPEDGTGLANSNSYVDVAFSDTYFTDRGNTTWTAATVDNKQVALIKATDYIDKRFGVRFKGRRASGTQALQWPREEAQDNDGYDLTGIPIKLEQATCEYAAIALSTVLAPNPVTNPGPDATGVLTRRDEQVGPVRESFTYKSTSAAVVQQINEGARRVTSNVVAEASLPEYPAADLLLEPCLITVDNRSFQEPVGAPVITGERTTNRFTRGQFDNDC